MGKIKLQPGDIFCTRNPMWLGRAINRVQKFRAKDNQSEYSHAGIILDTHGTTYEAVWTYAQQNLYEAYSGNKVLIGRHKDMTPEKAAAGYAFVSDVAGQPYPGLRLVMFAIFPSLAKFVSVKGRGVCSEHSAKFIHGSGVQNMYWLGKNPDDIADMIHKWKGWQTVFEGIIGEEI